MVWNLPENADLRARRDPNILYVGDVIYLPDNETKQESAATGARHNYVVDVEPTYFRLRLLAMELPRRNLRWALTTALDTSTGTTDDDGYLEARIDPQTDTAVLRLYPPDGAPQDYQVQMGMLDPIETISGVQQRLTNLGWDPGPVDGVNGPRTKAGVRQFQARYQLTVDGAAGPQTQRVLKQVHGG